MVKQLLKLFKDSDKIVINDFELELIRLIKSKHFHQIYSIKIDDSSVRISSISANKAYLSYLSKSEKKSGTETLKFIIDFLKGIGVKEIELADQAEVDCDKDKDMNNKIDLTRLSLLKNGMTFYEKFGFKIILKEHFFSFPIPVKPLVQSTFLSDLEKFTPFDFVKSVQTHFRKDESKLLEESRWKKIDVYSDVMISMRLLCGEKDPPKDINLRQFFVEMSTKNCMLTEMILDKMSYSVKIDRKSKKLDRQWDDIFFEGDDAFSALKRFCCYREYLTGFYWVLKID